ncbi:MAG: pitrilysin family protein [Paracoccus sp. (in: a-proteobacteria)]|nr:pitrilysin family protein [Paracoccus sp. (in: a-proteobacteria)]
MIRLPAALFACALLLPAPLRAFEITEITSPGGLTAWLAEDDSIPFVGLNIIFEGGASLDDPARRGAISLMASTLEEGAGDMDATDFARAVESLGASEEFNVADDALIVSARALSENRDEAAELLRLALTRPRFDEDAVARVRSQMLAVIRSEETDPSAIAGKAMARTLWGDHPYASPINGTSDSVAALTPDDLRDAAARVLARDRVLIAAAGDITGEELGEMVDLILGDLPETGSVPLPDEARFMGEGGAEIIDWDSPQTVIRFAQPGLPIDDPDYFAATIANHILGGGGFSSRLMDELRERRGLTYGVSSGLSNGVYGQSWGGGLSTSNATAGESVRLLRETWAAMAEGGVTEAELEAAKTYLTGEYPLRFDGNMRIAGILAGMQMIGLPIDYPSFRNDMVEAVTLDDVNRVARERLDADALSFVLVGRPEGMEEEAGETASD